MKPGQEVSKKDIQSPEVIVLYTASPWESAVVVLRVTAPAERAGLKVIKGNQGDRVSPELVSLADVVVIQRDFPRFRKAYAEVIARARTEGKPVIYEIDDLLLEMPEDHSTRRDYHGYLLAMIQAMVEADIVTASCPALVDYLRKFNPNTRLLPNYLDDQTWDFRTPDENQIGDFPVVIGYMGGETHQADLEFVSPALLNILERFEGRVKLRLFGGKPPELLLASPFVEWISFNRDHYAEFSQFFMRQVCDIFIAPLRDNLFNRCKSVIKYLEYSVQGIPGIYSHIPAYESIVEPGVNGFIAATLEDWEIHLAELIEQQALRRNVGKNAQETVRRNWLLSQHCQEWVEVYKEGIHWENVSHESSPGQIKPFLQVIKQAEEYLQELEEKNIELDRAAVTAGSQLEEILNSRSWRMLQKLQQIRIKLIPPGGHC
jgi:glycosyltransferase involved in cell wall biosynthesis